MTTEITMTDTEIEFKNANASQNCTLSLTDDSNLLSSRLVQFGNGLTSTTMTVGENASVIATSDFDEITTRNAKIGNASGDYVTLNAASSLTEYKLVLPDAQGAANTFVKNDGSGNLSFSTVALTDLSDTSSSTPSSGQFVIHDGSNFAYATSAAALTLTSSLSTNTIAEGTSGSGVTVDSVLLKDNEVTCTNVRATNYVYTNAIFEQTANSGTNIDGVLCKDNSISLTGTISVDTISENSSGNGVVIDSVTLKDKAVRYQGGASSGYVELKANDSTTTHTLTLPGAQGANESFLMNNGSGGLSWLTLAGHLVPTGVILPYGASSAPTGFLICNGNAENRSTYSALFAVIGTSFGAGNGSSTFNLPDCRGKFLRGFDNGAGNDPDASSRTGGDAVGSTQGHAFAAHTHAVNYSDLNPSGTTSVDTANEGWPYNAGGDSWANQGETDTGRSVTTVSTGSNETRPINVAVQYIIKY